MHLSPLDLVKILKHPMRPAQYAPSGCPTSKLGCYHCQSCPYLYVHYTCCVGPRQVHQGSTSCQASVSVYSEWWEHEAFVSLHSLKEGGKNTRVNCLLPLARTDSASPPACCSLCTDRPESKHKHLLCLLKYHCQQCVNKLQLRKYNGGTQGTVRKNALVCACKDKKLSSNFCGLQTKYWLLFNAHDIQTISANLVCQLRYSVGKTIHIVQLLKLK